MIPLTLQDVDIDTRAKSQRATTLSVGNDSIREYAMEILSLSALTQRRYKTYVSDSHVYGVDTDLNTYFKSRVTSFRTPPFTE